MSEIQTENPSVARVRKLSKQLIYLGLAIGLEGHCFQVMRWADSLYFFLVATALLLLALLLRIPFWKALGYQSLLSGLSTFALGILILFRTEHWPGSEVVGIICLGIIAAATLVRSFVTDDGDNLLPGGWLKTTFGVIAAGVLIGACFKIMHWPGADLILIISFQCAFVLLLILAHNPYRGLARSE